MSKERKVKERKKGKKLPRGGDDKAIRTIGLKSESSWTLNLE